MSLGVRGGKGYNNTHGLKVSVYANGCVAFISTSSCIRPSVLEILCSEVARSSCSITRYNMSYFGTSGPGMLRMGSFRVRELSLSGISGEGGLVVNLAKFAGMAT